MENRPKKELFVLVREAIGRKHYSKRTEESYIHWIKRYIFFHNPVVGPSTWLRTGLSNLKRHPLEMCISKRTGGAKPD
ncbi:MAG: phage integrase N-terminal SAM-like domain-containing protein [Thermodesulfobacteriota bacterium]